MAYNKAERLAIFRERLEKAPAARSAEEAYGLVARILNEVEDEFSGARFDPTQWKTDGRMYPPYEDNRHAVVGHPNIIRYRSIAHNTFIGSNGAIEISTIRGEILVRKPGEDGRDIWQI